jgi:RNA polymerase sigma factor (sigma-70 family)
MTSPDRYDLLALRRASRATADRANLGDCVWLSQPVFGSRGRWGDNNERLTLRPTGFPRADRSRMTLVYPDSSQLSEPTEPSDAQLVVAVRAGDRDAYGRLYERHQPAARGIACQLTRSPADADDLVAEAFAKVFGILQSGRGPDSAFRAYLLTTLRHVLYERVRRDRRIELSDDMARHDEGVPWTDPVEAELESSLVVRAFSHLPERWRTVLWYSEVEQQSATEIGVRLGLRPNAAAALAYRAREGLRQAYLQAHVAGSHDENCRAAVERLGGWTRRKLSAGDSTLVEQHLAGCGSCQRLAAEVQDVNSGIRGVLTWLVVGGGAAAEHLPSVVQGSTLGGAASGAAVLGAAAASGGGVTGATAGAAGAVGGGSAVGSVATWLLGTHAGQAAAVLTAVVVGGTAVAAGTGMPDLGHRAPAPVRAVAAAGAGPAGSLALDHARPGRVGKPSGSGSTAAGPSKAKPSKGQPSKGQPSKGKPPAEAKGKPSADKPTEAKQAETTPTNGEPQSTPPPGTASQGTASQGTGSQNKAVADKPSETRSSTEPSTPVRSGKPAPIASPRQSTQSPSTSGSAAVESSKGTKDAAASKPEPATRERQAVPNSTG